MDNSKKVTINWKGIEYPLVFNLNVYEEIQNEYGTVDKWVSKIEKEEPNIKAFKFGMAQMINEGIDILNEETEEQIKPLTLKQVGRLITEVPFTDSQIALKNAMTNSIGNTEEKNQKANEMKIN